MTRTPPDPDTDPAVGAYTDNRSSGSKLIPILLGLLALLALILLALWLFGAFGGDDDVERDALDRDADVNEVQVDEDDASGTVDVIVPDNQ